ncbi:hypothetical protein GE061_012141 [Apolygus lucorum]|uniref:Uncharacterized protein n=1 Tax=Apolygus lucorum TaxID=248454 RepID=A0A8S9XTR1_APOLU|nr:hypothetical protein GE061_012141 [Apolygus lucorum]
MHLNRWKSVLVSWANALEIVPTTLNFVGDLSPEFFVKLCSFLKRTDVSTLQEAVEYISGYYQSLILGYEDDENYVALLATVYLLFTSVHKTNDELCKRLSSVSNYEQAAIKSALEAFIDIQPPKLTKDLIFMTLAQLPDGPDPN